MDLSVATVWWVVAGALVAAELATGTFYLLMLALGLAAGGARGALRRSASPRSSSSAPSSAAARSRPGTCTAARGRAGRRPRANRDVNLDIGERVHVDAWDADGTAARRATAARTGPRGSHAGAPRRAPAST